MAHDVLVEPEELGLLAQGREHAVGVEDAARHGLRPVGADEGLQPLQM